MTIHTVSKIVLGFICSVFLRDLQAKDVDIRPATALKHGIKIDLSIPNPDVVQATLTFSDLPKEVGLVLQNAQDRFIASIPLLPRGHTYVAIIATDYVEHSHFVFPYIAHPDEQVYRVFLRDKP